VKNTCLKTLDTCPSESLFYIKDSWFISNKSTHKIRNVGDLDRRPYKSKITNKNGERIYDFGVGY
jgi:hypothetical protein